MKFLTKKQKQWMISRTIKVDGIYMFPRFGFEVYAEPNYSSSEHIDTNPFTKSLDSQLFHVKEKTNGFCRGNFYHNPKGRDWYMTEDDLAARGLLEMSIYFILSFIPLAIYNLCLGGVDKIEKTDA